MWADQSAPGIDSHFLHCQTLQQYGWILKMCWGLLSGRLGIWLLLDHEFVRCGAFWRFSSSFLSIVIRSTSVRDFWSQQEESGLEVFFLKNLYHVIFLDFDQFLTLLIHHHYHKNLLLPLYQLLKNLLWKISMRCSLWHQQNKLWI